MEALKQGVRHRCRGRPEGCFAQRVPDPFVSASHGFFFSSTGLHKHLVHQAKVLGFVGVEIAVALGFLFDVTKRLAGVLGQDFVEAMAFLDDFVGLDFDVGNLAADLAPGLVDHDLGVGQGVALALGAAARMMAAPLAARPMQ